MPATPLSPLGLPRCFSLTASEPAPTAIEIEGGPLPTRQEVVEWLTRGLLHSHLAPRPALTTLLDASLHPLVDHEVLSRDLFEPLLRDNPMHELCTRCCGADEARRSVLIETMSNLQAIHAIRTRCTCHFNAAALVDTPAWPVVELLEPYRHVRQ